MTEKEKGRKGLLYNPNHDATLIGERASCKKLCQEYNATGYADLDKRMRLIRQIVRETKNNFLVEQPFWCDYGYNIVLGENFYANHNLVILDGAEVLFGDNVFIGPNSSFYTAGHPIDAVKRNEGLEYNYPITVGNNVWIGGNVVVLPGISIGDNVVIGAGSVVTKNIPPNVIAAGNPCRIIKEINNVLS